jgi:hypothetical protein
MVPEIRTIFITKINRCGQDLKQEQASWISVESWTLKV